MRSRGIVIFGVILLLVVPYAAAVSAPSVANAYTIGEHSCESCETYEEQQAEHAAQEQREANERAAKAAEEKKATEEREQRETVERQQREAYEHQRQGVEHEEAQAKEAQAKEAAEKEQKAKEACVVPSLKGDSLNKATTALRRAHCALGKVSRPRKGKGKLAVTAQTLKPGTKSASDTAVGVTLGRPATRTHRPT
jgi:hypothetical protein